MMVPACRHLPRRRGGQTTSVTIGGERFHLIANAGADGALGEVLIQSGRYGSDHGGLMHTYAAALNVALQHGVPLADLVRTGIGLRFVPSGHTDDPDIPRVRSVSDYIARRLAIDWLPFGERAALGIYTLAERVRSASRWMDSALAEHGAPAHYADHAAAPAGVA